MVDLAIRNYVGALLEETEGGDHHSKRKAVRGGKGYDKRIKEEDTCETFVDPNLQEW